MKLTRENLRKTKAKQIEDVILFVVNEQRFAIAANTVDEIRNLDGLTPLPPALRHSRLAKVNSTLVRGSKDPDKVYFVVDAATHFGLTPAEPARVLVLRDAPVALLVSNIDRMTQISTVVALPMAFSGNEREWYRGLALLGEQVVPLVSPEAFLNKGEQAVLKASWKGLAAAKGAVSA
ncbi:MAG TPA: chemotaxis protein CheW [Terriglobales bacterium]|nr:chemotaxis protein CheW [Terriglobales bacterium]